LAIFYQATPDPVGNISPEYSQIARRSLAIRGRRAGLTRRIATRARPTHLAERAVWLGAKMES